MTACFRWMRERAIDVRDKIFMLFRLCHCSLSVGFSLCDMTMNELAPPSPVSLVWVLLLLSTRTSRSLDEWVKSEMRTSEGFAKLVDNDNRSQNFSWVTGILLPSEHQLCHIFLTTRVQILSCLDGYFVVLFLCSWNEIITHKKKVKWKVSRCFPTKVRDKIQIYDLVADTNPPHFSRVSRSSDIRVRKTELVQIPRWIRNGYDNIENSRLWWYDN